MADALSSAGLRPPERLFLRYPHELSGGQRQRVLIAGALALQPELLIADEPVSSLDASIRGEILALLLKLRTELGLGVLVVTHDLGLAWNIADRTAVMYLGRVVEAGPDRGGARRAAAPLHAGPAVRGPGDGAAGAGRPRGGDPGPDPDPVGVPLPPAVPGAGLRRGAAAGVDDACRRTPLAVLPASADTGAPATSSRRAIWPAVRSDHGAGRSAGRAAAGAVRRPGGVRRRARPGAVRRVVLRRPTVRPRARRARPGRSCRRRRGVGAGHQRRGGRAARGVQRLPAPGSQLFTAVPGRRAGVHRGRLAALPVPLLDLRAGRLAAAAPHAELAEDERPAFALQAGRGRRVGGLRVRPPRHPGDHASPRRWRGRRGRWRTTRWASWSPGCGSATRSRPTTRCSPRTTTSATTAARCTPS